MGDEAPATPTREERWTAATEWPLVAVALAFLVAYAWPILDTDLTAGAVATCEAVTWLAWGGFAADLAVRIALADDRPRYVLRHLHEVAVIALPVLRSLRLLRLLMVITAVNRRAGTALRGRVAVYVAGATALLALLAALAVLDAERESPEATIAGFGDALWWAVTTITTVGYGDRYPVTPAGRAVAVGLMLAGIALLGVVTATIASWIVERVSAENAAEPSATAAHVERLLIEIRELRRQHEELARHLGGQPTSSVQDPPGSR